MKKLSNNELKKALLYIRSSMLYKFYKEEKPLNEFLISHPLKKKFTCFGYGSTKIQQLSELCINFLKRAAPQTFPWKILLSMTKSLIENVLFHVDDCKKKT